MHFWKYYDLAGRRVLDNRFIIANLIACESDTPRVTGNYDVFDIQEKVIESILRGYQEQQALVEAPKTVDPVQQTVATIIQAYMNRPEVNRTDALAAIRFLGKPAPSVVVKELRASYRRFQTEADVVALLSGVLTLAVCYQANGDVTRSVSRRLQREDLRLICFDHLCS